MIAEITGCGELALDGGLAHGRKAISRWPEVLDAAGARDREGPRPVSQWIDAAGNYMVFRRRAPLSCAAP